MHPIDFLYLSCLVLTVSAKNILIFNPIFGYSHVKFTSQVANIIADHGHNVTLLQPVHIALKNTEKLVKNKNVQIINYYPDHYEELLKTETQTFPEFWNSRLTANVLVSCFVLPKFIAGTFERTTTQLMKDQNLFDELRSRNFDVMISETFDIAGLYIAHLLNIQCIPIMSTVHFQAVNDEFGQPSGVGYIQQDGSELAPKAGFLDRLNDLYQTFFLNLAMERVMAYQHNYIENSLGLALPHWKDLVIHSPFYFTNSNPYLDFATPTTDAIVHIGGVTIDMNSIKNVSPLPKEYEEILQERESTVLISFGSVIRSYEMPENYKDGIIKMFHSLSNVTFIWKYEKDDEEFQKRLPQNVYLKKWVPQPSLLADNRLKVFVTHGGLGSTMEVAYSGKPALMIPIFGDQLTNANMLASHGGAIAFDRFYLADGEKLTEIIGDLVFNPKYDKNAKSLQKVLSMQPIDPKLNLIKHLEFAMEFPYFRSHVPAINKTGLIARYYLDIIALFGLSAVITVYISFKYIRRRLTIRLISKKTKRD